MKPLHLMSKDEIRTAIDVRAQMFAYLDHSRRHPNADKAQAEAFVRDHWREFRDKAKDLLATQLADAEQRTPMN
jgi:hypothetical protein